MMALDVLELSERKNDMVYVVFMSNFLYSTHSLVAIKEINDMKTTFYTVGQWTPRESPSRDTLISEAQLSATDGHCDMNVMATYLLGVLAYDAPSVNDDRLVSVSTGSAPGVAVAETKKEEKVEEKEESDDDMGFILLD
ncbi:tRNA synthetase class I (I [Striga asiatica]|uniref:tRNA synthetase class I (I) n=1 Tax=Striga asiatica TaxID=4170 RepID=A0A5A7Q7D4_STRAF|nr:tRNA synthetase class I (I [Striga asiatica]